MRSLVERIAARLRALFTSPPVPVPRVRARFARGYCPDCGRAVALTSRGTWRHSCRPVPDKDAA